MNAICVTAALSWITDILLAVAALYVSGQALRGWCKERQAIIEADDNKRASLEEDAKTLYVSASLSQAWVLFFIFGGTLIKVGLRIYEAL